MSAESENPKNQSAREKEYREELEQKHFRDMNAKAGFDEPWFFGGQLRCFVCGAVLHEETKTEEHLIPKWLIKRYDLDKTEGRGQKKKYLHPFDFGSVGSECAVPYRKLTAPACPTCNSGYLLSVEREMRKMFKLPIKPASITSARHLVAWLAKILWGLQWYLLSELTRHSQRELVLARWKATRILRQTLAELRRNMNFSSGSVPASLFLYDCQSPELLEEQFDFQVSLPRNLVWMRIDRLVLVIAFDFGWQGHWQKDFFNQFAGMYLHPWQAEEIGALFFNAAGCRPQLPTSAVAVYKEGASIHVLDLGLFKPLAQNEDDLIDLLTIFRRCARDEIEFPNRQRHTVLFGPNGNRIFVDIEEHPWRRKKGGRTGNPG